MRNSVGRVVVVVAAVLGLPAVAAYGVLLAGVACVPLDNVGLPTSCESWPYVALFVLPVNVSIAIVLAVFALRALRRSIALAACRLGLAAVALLFAPLVVLFALAVLRSL